jgi:dTDP-4-dehydrorhamnose reductase
VFDGNKSGAYVEQDATAPQSVYGQSKQQGELSIQLSGCRHFIFRTSWVYAARGNNFAKTMIKLASERDELKVVSDQFGAPTSAELIADVTSLTVQRLKNDATFGQQYSGIYHLVANGVTTWHAFAQFVLEKADNLGIELKVKADDIQPILTSEYPTPAQRPKNSQLNTDKLEQLLSVVLPNWQYHAERMIKEYL